LDPAICHSKRYDLQVDRLSNADGHFIAGFLEGEAHFGITEGNGGQSFAPFVTMRLRDDDADLVAWLRRTTGLGLIRPIAARATSKPQVEWRVQTQADCIALAAILGEFPVRGRRRGEVEIWRRAVEAWTSWPGERALVLRRLRERLRESRRFRPPDDRPLASPETPEVLRFYLHGLIAAEGSFSLRTGDVGLSVHMRADERPLLEMLARTTGVGRVRDQPASGTSRPSATWEVSRLADVERLAGWLEPEALRGRKAAELEIWKRAVQERAAARAAGTRVARSRMRQLVSELQAAREYRPGVVTPIGRQSKRDETLDVLRAWAADTPGSLSCTRYTADRQPGWPTRSTITRRLGSWDAALAAAGLSDRAASPGELRRARGRGGAAARAAHDAAQRERILAALRYLITVHGSVPSAMQFFRWRLIEAPGTPTQATVYRVFPGGWQAVLDALGEVDPSVLCNPSPGGEAATAA
jgi:hypothetical protein